MEIRTKHICLTILVFLLALPMWAKQFTLVIDAGHGGHDAGAVGSFSKEKNINLTMALAFGKLVEQNCPDVRVVYTRKTDVFVTLDGRADIANKAKADLFISIHTNALPNGKIARGLETYTLGMHRQADNLAVAKRENQVITYEKDYKRRYEGFDPSSSESYIMFEFMQDKNMENSVDMAKMVQKETCRLASRPDKGVHQAGFLVLRQTSMPSCLIELGFISTPDEEQLLNNKQSVDQMARGIYNAFVSYRKKYDKTITVPYRTYDQETVKPEPKPEPKPEAKTEAKPEAKPEPKKNAPVAEPQKDTKQESRAEVQPKADSKPASVSTGDAPVFKVQILTASKPLAAKDSRLKGCEAEYYNESGMLKYTVGASANYQEIYQLRKTLLEKFPEAFIVAFKNGEKMNVNEAIREYKANKNK